MPISYEYKKLSLKIEQTSMNEIGIIKDGYYVHSKVRGKLYKENNRKIICDKRIKI